jgi:DNA-binding NarL/FixJ family response regulator
MTSVLIVDDHPVVLKGCRRILEDARIKTILKQATPREVTSFFASIDLTWSSSIFPSGITVSRVSR